MADSLWLLNINRFRGLLRMTTREVIVMRAARAARLGARAGRLNRVAGQQLTAGRNPWEALQSFGKPWEALGSH